MPRPQISANAPAILGLLGSLSLHALLLQSLLLGSVTPNRPVKQGAGSIELGGMLTAENPLILLQIPDSTPEDSVPIQELASKGDALKNLPVMFLSDDPTPPSAGIPEPTNDPDADEQITSGDPEGHARLFGIYTGQLQAHIERLWRRPRTGVNDGTTGPADMDEAFRCQVAIRQDARGRILEILLPHCNGSSAWQLSLVKAVQSAGPLPVPPYPFLFSETLTLNFVGYPFETDGTSDGYEIPEHDYVSASR